MRSDRLATALSIVLMTTAFHLCANDQDHASRPFAPIPTVISADCWGHWPENVLAAVVGCKTADGANRQRLWVIDDAQGPVRVGLSPHCQGLTCATLTQVLSAVPERRLLLQTPATRLNAVVAAVNSAQAQARIEIEPILHHPQGSSPPIALGPGVRYWREHLHTPATVMLHIVEVDLDTPGLQLVSTPKHQQDGSAFIARPTTGFVRDEHLLVAINADYFLPFDGGHLLDQPFIPIAGQPVNTQGLAISRGTRISPALTDDRRVNAALCVDARGHAQIRRGDCPHGTRLGIGAGPLLLLNGQRQARESSRADYYQHPQPRTAIGLDRRHRHLWLVVADGRQPGYSEGLSLDALTEVFERLGADAAMNLDGGGSSILAATVAGEVRILNSPIHTGIPGRERPVANHLGVRIQHP